MKNIKGKPICNAQQHSRSAFHITFMFNISYTLQLPRKLSNHSSLSTKKNSPWNVSPASFSSFFLFHPLSLIFFFLRRPCFPFQCYLIELALFLAIFQLFLPVTTVLHRKAQELIWHTKNLHRSCWIWRDPCSQKHDYL